MTDRIDLAALKQQIPDALPDGPATRGIAKILEGAVAALTALGLASGAAPLVGPDPAAFEIGQAVGDKGIFIGWYDPATDAMSMRPGPAHNVALFAAPTDVKKPDGKSNLTLTFNKMVKHILTLANFAGHDGEQLPANRYEPALRTRLQNLQAGEGTGWFIGTMEMVRRQYESRNMDALKDTFRIFRKKDNEEPEWYWSCSPSGQRALRPSEESIWAVNFNFHAMTEAEQEQLEDSPEYWAEDWHLKSGYEMSLRPVRAERFRIGN